MTLVSSQRFSKSPAVCQKRFDFKTHTTTTSNEGSSCSHRKVYHSKTPVSVERKREDEGTASSKKENSSKARESGSGKKEESKKQSGSAKQHR